MAELFVATGDGFARITQRGHAWTVTLALTGSGVQCLAPDPHDRGTLYAGSRGKGVFKSTDGGAHWQQLDLPQPDVFSLAVSPADGSVYAGCEPSMLFRSADGGKSWRALDVGGAQKVHALVLGIDGRNLYAASERGIYRLRLR